MRKAEKERAQDPYEVGEACLRGHEWHTSSGHKAEQQSQEPGDLPGLASVACRSQVGSCGQVVSLWLLVEYIILPQGPLVTRREFGVDEGTHNPETAAAQLSHQSKLPSQGQSEAMGVLHAWI